MGRWIAPLLAGPGVYPEGRFRQTPAWPGKAGRRRFAAPFNVFQGDADEKLCPPPRVSPLLVIAFAAAAWGGTALANSAVVFNPANGHFYQRFDTAPAGWDLAKGKCQSLNAHLVTFTNDAEHDFVYSQLVSKAPVTYRRYFWLGATYDPDTVSWSWITGERFPFTFGFGNGTSNILVMTGNDGSYGNAESNGYDVTWSNQGYYNAGYVCEWDGNAVTGSATVPDLNRNGVAEIATLYLDYKTNKHTVSIRDPKTHVEISKLTFGNGPTPPVGLAVVADLNGNHVSEIAVLSGSAVQIKDARDKALPARTVSFSFLSSGGFQARALSAMPDANRNGSSELTVVGVQQNGKTITQTRDSKTGALLFSDIF